MIRHQNDTMIIRQSSQAAMSKHLNWNRVQKADAVRRCIESYSPPKRASELSEEEQLARLKRRLEAEQRHKDRLATEGNAPTLRKLQACSVSSRAKTVSLPKLSFLDKDSP
jgi:uncharacterized protein involved in type VI secretion and phage assembly